MSRLVTDHLPLLAGAPNGVKRLRELILELAVRGVLVRQDSENRPAGDLLGIYKIESNSSHLPGWRTVKLGEIGKVIGGATPSKANPEFWSGDIPWVSPKDMKRPVISDAEDHISECALNGSSLKIIPTGSILMVVRGMILAHSFPVAMTTRPTTINQDMKALAVPEALKDYLLLFLQASKSRLVALVDRSSHGTCKLVSDKLWQFNVDFPPLAEQHRIIAKVDELMALCDRLETRQSDAQAAHARLVDELLGSLLQARDAEDFAECWGRVKGSFDVLFTTEQSVDALKQVILQLAILGKLTRPDKNEENATQFLRKNGIAATPCDHSNWAEVALGDLGTVMSGATPNKANSAYWDGDIPWVSPKDMKRPVIEDATDHISEKAIQESSLKLMPPGSILMVVRGMILVHSFPVAITARAVTINQDMKALIVPPQISEYVLLFLQASKTAVVNLVDRSSHGTCKLVSDKLWALKVQIPPLAEQQRIFTKVDELTALCDQIKFKVGQAQELNERLTGALVEKAVS